MIEVVTALGMATAIFACGALYLHASFGLVEYQLDNRAAAETALSQIDTLRSSSVGVLENCVSKPIVVDMPGFKRLKDAKCTLSIEDYANVPGIKKVLVCVSWTGGRMTRHVRRETLIRSNR
jgi:hypothetical protein